MDKEVVKELIQDDFNSRQLKTELNKILQGAERAKMIENYNILEEKLGGVGASEKTAHLIVSSIKK